MPRLFSESVGGRGYTVNIRERAPGGPLYLLCRGSWQSLGHRDVKLARQAARALAGELLAAKQAMDRGERPLHLLFARYQAEVSRYKKGAQPAEDARRIDVWESFFDRAKDARTITVGDLQRFERMRRAGEIKVRGRALSKRVSLTTIGADIVFLLSVLNWATRVHDGDVRLLEANPVAGYRIPRTPAPKRPVASRARFLRVYRHTPYVDGQGMFRYFFALIGGELDWRVSALCQVRIPHVDLTARPEDGCPWGRIWRDGATDKEGAAGWVPLSPWGRRVLQRALRHRGAIGDVYLFESPRKPGRPWSRWHARDLLERAEARADVRSIDGGDFHPYRRLWSTLRKDQPWADIQAVTGRKDRRTFEASYTAADPDTMLAVVMAGRKPARSVSRKIDTPRRAGGAE